MIKKFAVVTTVGLLAAACGGGGEDTIDTTPTTEATTTTTEVAETTTTTTTEPAESTTTTTLVPGDDSIRQPLTGEIVESTDELVALPALIVKIDNNDANARQNHSGLAVADIVFEEIVEGDTRFAAVFHTEGSDPVGPIRSGREQDVNLLSSFNEPLLAWSGGNPGVTRLIASSFLTDLNAQRNSGSYFRGPGRSPHDLYSTTERLYELTPDDHPGPPAQQFTYVPPGEEFEGMAHSEVQLSLDGKSVRWEWDDAAGGYARFQSGSRHTDVVHGDIFASNVIVLGVDYIPSTIDAAAPDGQTLGSGPVFVFSNGQVQTGRWARELAVGPFRLTDADGEPIGLTPGNTWVELADNDDASFTTRVGDDIDTATIPQLDLGTPDAFPIDITIS
ncbi:MAG: DUF3048 domain-containing protein [Ilumatobacter sp.]